MLKKKLKLNSFLGLHVVIKNLLFHPFSTSGVSKSLCKRIVVYFQLRHLFVLICGHSNELTLFEDVGPESGVWKL